MVPVEHQLHNILLRHFGQLSRKDVLQVEEVFQIFVILIILDDLERNLVVLLLKFSSAVPGHEAQANVLNR